MSRAGFWRLGHGDLEALLAREDLCWEIVRVYLALADLTIGYGRERDVVSLGQIVELAGVEGPHVCRALRKLETLGLYGHEPGEGQEKRRWVTWPPSPVGEAGTTAGGDSGTTAKAGSTSTAKGTAKAGRHQDKRLRKTRKKGGKGARGLHVDFPSELDTDEFRRAWSEWEQYRVEARKALTPSTRTAQLKKLAKDGPVVGARLLAQSIEQGWQGIFPLKEDARTGGKKQRPGYVPAKGDASIYDKLGEKM